MELTLAKTNLEQKAQKISLEKLAEKLKSDHDQVFYFDRSTNHKDLLKAVSFFENKGRKAYLSEIKISLDEKDYIYELHII
ncbi:hypothetical protein BKH41_08405 [Helicobacter sp. 12S02232-10]|uniref:HP0268 family nuclease n=1 Tax=Helicobacter sp. 12S02232-10 TaxID=1476197 RepID=UPI000BA73415|nr:HP0268 family nuclease [Helicobacter sp. 12S02232-10]PAF46880.1 hypothetical protein BKH41_08405 [Helicobacter sp. 12S02232-10]